MFKDPRNTFAGMRNYQTIFWSLRFHGRIFFSKLYVEVRGAAPPPALLSPFAAWPAGRLLMAGGRAGLVGGWVDGWSWTQGPTARTHNARPTLAPPARQVKRIWQPEENVIRMRWTVHGIPRVPWEAEGVFDGISQYR